MGAKEDLQISLEERKIMEKNRKALHLANKEKDRVRVQLDCLRARFKQVLDSNRSLPEPLRFTDDYFRLDERIENALVEEARLEMDALKSKYEFDYEKSALGLKKVQNYFVDQIITVEYEVKAIL